MSLIIRPNYPKDYAIFKPYGLNKAIILYEGTKEQCEKELPRIKKQERFEEILEEEDINVYTSEYTDGNGYSYDIGYSTDAGEDFHFDLNGETIEDIVKDLQHYAFEFDANKHAKSWVEYCGTNGVPNDLRVLIEDAESIKEKLNNLEKKVRDLI